jgi:hypothetical protein
MDLVFHEICEWQHIILNSQQIKGMLLGNTIMGYVFLMDLVFHEICEWQHIILNS